MRGACRVVGERVSHLPWFLRMHDLWTRQRPHATHMFMLFGASSMPEARQDPEVLSRCTLLRHKAASDSRLRCIGRCRWHRLAASFAGTGRLFGDPFPSDFGALSDPHRPAADLEWVPQNCPAPRGSRRARARDDEVRTRARRADRGAGVARNTSVATTPCALALFQPAEGMRNLRARTYGGR